MWWVDHRLMMKRWWPPWVDPDLISLLISKDSYRLFKRCHKPDHKEFSKVAVHTAIGFVVMGFVGFFVKLIFIPI